MRWTWSSGGHSTTSGSPGQPNGIWDSGIHNQGATFTRTFNSAGTFPYYCIPHGGCCSMVGTVMVVNASPTPTPTPRPTSTPTPTPRPTSTPTPTPGCYPNFTTAEGCDALNSLTTGAGNTGLGWRVALFGYHRQLQYWCRRWSAGPKQRRFQYRSWRGSACCSTPAAHKTPPLELMRSSLTTAVPPTLPLVTLRS